MANLYEAKSGKKVLHTYGNLQQVIEQAKQSGKIGAILGDGRFIEHSKLKVNTPIPIGNGKLVLVGSKKARLKKLEDLSKFKQIALPDAKKAIYGIVAVEFLQNAKLYEKLESKLLFLATVPQVSTYLIDGSVEVGFINISDYLASKDKLDTMIEIDSSLYSPINISIATLQKSKNKELGAFIEFVSTNEEAKAIFAKYGL
ncbi:molybdate ABC transporter substrate-binding protein [Helicobacter sp. 23-1048]